MIKDLNKIRENLNGYESIESVNLFDDLKKGCHIRYITLDKNDNESFYLGGNFERLGNNCIVLKNNFKTWSVPINKYNPDGSIHYKTRFYNKNEEDNCEKEKKELMDTIHYQQSIIEKMTDRLTELELIKKKLTGEKVEYEQLLQQNRYNLKDKCIEVRDKDNKLKEYEIIIQRLTNSHQIFHK